MTTTTRLTAADLDRALRDERHHGFGYAERRYLSSARRLEMDAAVIAVANTLGWDYDQLFAWVDGKAARFACDRATYKDTPALDIVQSLLHDGWDRR